MIYIWIDRWSGGVSLEGRKWLVRQCWNIRFNSNTGSEPEFALIFEPVLTDELIFV
ncbi:hypothetical protein ES702_03147 [subsurface metagenome]